MLTHVFNVCFVQQASVCFTLIIQWCFVFDDFQSLFLEITGYFSILQDYHRY